MATVTLYADFGESVFDSNVVNLSVNVGSISPTSTTAGSLASGVLVTVNDGAVVTASIADGACAGNVAYQTITSSSVANRGLKYYWDPTDPGPVSGSKWDTVDKSDLVNMTFSTPYVSYNTSASIDYYRFSGGSFVDQNWMSWGTYQGAVIPDFISGSGAKEYSIVFHYYIVPKTAGFDDEQILWVGDRDNVTGGHLDFRLKDTGTNSNIFQIRTNGADETFGTANQGGVWTQITYVQNGSNFNDATVYIGTSSYSPSSSVSMAVGGTYDHFQFGMTPPSVTPLQDWSNNSQLGPVLLYDKALTAAEVEQNYNYFQPRY